MRSDLLDSPLAWALKAGMDYAAVNQRLISDNIANAETPNYKAVHLNFDDYFEKAKRATDERLKELVPEAKDYIFRDESTTMRLDGNNIDAEKEMVELARNGLTYATLTELANRRGGLLKLAITQGRG